MHKHVSHSASLKVIYRIVFISTISGTDYYHLHSLALISGIECHKRTYSKAFFIFASTGIDDLFKVTDIQGQPNHPSGWQGCTEKG